MGLPPMGLAKDTAIDCGGRGVGLPPMGQRLADTWGGRGVGLPPMGQAMAAVDEARTRPVTAKKAFSLYMR